MIALSMGDPPPGAASCQIDLAVLKAGAYGVPVRLDTATIGWMRYFLGAGRPLFERWLERKKMVEPLLAPKLKKAGLPPETLALAMIESGLNPQARSRLGALGIWQLMPQTATALGLRVGPELDERGLVDPSTRAALRLLTELHARFGDWELAWAAYNGGPAKLTKAIEATGSRDFARLAESGRLGAETANFVPKIQAVVVLLSHWQRLKACVYKPQGP